MSKKVKSKEPKLSDFYDENDPRGCSTSEYDEYIKALNNWKKLNKNGRKS